MIWHLIIEGVLVAVIIFQGLHIMKLHKKIRKLAKVSE